MLIGYGCENFRAFEYANLDIKPITILLGANGVGKTSLLQIPLLFQQTANSSSREYRSPLKIHGHSVGFGDALNIIYKHNESEACSLSIKFTDEELVSLVRGRLLSEYQSYIIELGEFAQYQMIRQSDDSKSYSSPRYINILGDLRRQRNHKSPPTLENIEAVLSILKEVEGDLDLSEWLSFRPSPFSFFGRYGKKRSGKGVISPDNIRATYDFLMRLRSINPTCFTVEFGFSVKPGEGEIRKLESREIKLYFDNTLFISLRAPRSAKTISVTSDLLTKEETASLAIDLAGALDLQAPVFHILRPDDGPSESHMRDIVLSVLRRALSSLEQSFRSDMINHVGPLRAYPKRYYFLDIAATGSPQGDSLVELLRENVKLRDEVNSWLARFGIKIDVEQYREVIHRLAVNRENLGFDLDITDVGFGLSQVLPVITQSFLAKPGSITVIEQPEIHLHPNMQADLADLFISVVNKGQAGEPKPNLIIETHSEYLLNRLRRRIAERAISSDDVALYFVERDRAVGEVKSHVRRVEISSAGAFEWPLEFFENTLEDTLQFLELQE